ncbi:MAG: dCTP deaminase [Gammaproteobacteria bacterium]|nr:dCTP deaminase [Gammaproteobacteria bacterium]
MILNDTGIREAVTNGSIEIDPFDDGAVEPASYDLHVGAQAASAASKRITDLRNRGFVQIRPGDFVIVTVHEALKLDDRHVGRFGLTSAHARRGLIATVGPQIDPGYHGRLTVGLTNLSSKAITLSHMDTFLSVEFHRLQAPASKPYSGRYQDRLQLAPDDISEVMEREYMSQTEMMRTLEALVSSVEGLKQVVNSRLPLIFGGFLALYSILMTVFMAVLN